jgi:hypothetical protein
MKRGEWRGARVDERNPRVCPNGSTMDAVCVVGMAADGYKNALVDF